MQGYSSVAMQVALALGDVIIRRQLGGSGLSAPQVGLEEAKTSRAKPYGTEGLNTFRMVPRKARFWEFLEGDAGATGQLSGHPHSRCEPGKTVLPKTPWALVPWGRALLLACGLQCCPTQDRGVQVLVSAALGAKAPACLLSLSRGPLCLRYCLREELQPFGESKRVCAAIPRTSQLQGGLARVGFRLPGCVHGCVVV